MSGPSEMRSPAGQGEASKGDDLEKAVTSTIAETRSTRQAAWAERNPLKRWAHGATRSAIKRGLLVPPDRCEKCGKPGRIEAHHADHRRVLDVRFWCAPCHRKHHTAERRRLRQGGAS